MTAVEQLETFCICDLTGEPELCPGGKFCEIHQGGEFQAPPIVGKIIAGYKEKLLYFQREYQDEAGRTQAIAAAVAAERIALVECIRSSSWSGTEEIVAMIKRRETP